MSGVDNCYDNAFMGPCFGTITREPELTAYVDSVETVRELSCYVRYYNQQRRHSSLGYLTPANSRSDQPCRFKRMDCRRNPKHPGWPSDVTERAARPKSSSKTFLDSIQSPVTSTICSRSLVFSRGGTSVEKKDFMVLYAPGDDGRTWTHKSRLTGFQRVNGNLLKVQDGRVLFCYGNRASDRGQKRLEAMISADNGETPFD